MKLRISSCKPIALKKDIFRFWPLWVLYLIAMLMFLPNMIDYRSYDRLAYSFMGGSIPAFGIVNMGYAFLCVQLLFGDLFNTKLCYSLHAMPFRREGWLATHLLSGILFSLVPSLVGCGVMMLALEKYWFLSLYWLLASTMEFLFFFALAALSALLVGNRFALLAVYGICNFLSLLLYAAVNVVYIPHLEGVIVNFADFSRFSPVVQIFSYGFFKFTRIRIGNGNPYEESYTNFYRYDGLSDGWGYLAILSGIAVLMIGLCFWLYRKRHLESAGDFVAFSWLKGPMCLILTLCVTLVFAMLGVAFEAILLWVLVGLFIGFFGSLMLLERRLKVFGKKTLIRFGILVIAVCISMLAVALDWLGIESWLPKADSVASITVSDYNTENNYSYDQGYATTVTEQEDIALLLQAHEDILNRLDLEVTNGYRVYLTYTMKSGRVVRRSYYAPANGDNYRIIRNYLFTTPNLLGYTDAQAAAQNVSYISTGMGTIPEEFYEKVLEALLLDAKEGYVLRDKSSAGDLMLEYNLESENGGNIYRYLSISADAPRLIPLLKSPEIAMGYSDWDAFLEKVQWVNIEGVGTEQGFEKSEFAGLLEALRKDIEAGNIDPWAYISNTPCICYEYPTPSGIYVYRQIYIPKEATYVHDWLAAYNEGTK